MERTTELAPIVVEAGTVLAGRYEVVRRAGSGGMGLVFEVHDKALHNTPLALKLLSPARDEGLTEDEMLMRFRNEVLIMRQLAHPNIVRTFDFGQLPDGRFFMTMEYVDGSTLEELIKSSFFSRSNIHYVTLILIKILDAIQEAHRQGVIHRDLKSANVLISHGGEVKVTDFGLARTKGAARRITMTGECVGTPVYMSPEQVQGLACDHRVDIYALGIIAHEIVTGEVPFSDESWYGLANKIVHHPIRSFATPENRVPLWYEGFVFRTTQKNPDDRFATAEEAGAFLRSYLFTLEAERRMEIRSEGHTAPRILDFDYDPARERMRRKRTLLELLLVALIAVITATVACLGYLFFTGKVSFSPTASGPPDDFFRPMSLAPPRELSNTLPEVVRPSSPPQPAGSFRLIFPGTGGAKTTAGPIQAQPGSSR